MLLASSGKKASEPHKTNQSLKKVVLNIYRAELHIHTVLSPCAGVEMIPPLIVREALKRGLNLIGITDHNASENASAVIKAAKGENLTVLPGMELQTQEEVHVLCLFDTLTQLAEFQSQVDKRLPKMQNRPDFFGEQFIVDHTGDFIRNKEQLLITSTSYSFEEAFYAVTELEGLFIPAHVNRQAYGLINYLGFVPPNLEIDALEISRHITPEEAVKTFPQIKGFPLIQSGDVHFLSDFLGVNRFIIEQPTIKELKKALRQEENRSFKLEFDI